MCLLQGLLNWEIEKVIIFYECLISWLYELWKQCMGYFSDLLAAKESLKNLNYFIDYDCWYKH